MIIPRVLLRLEAGDWFLVAIVLLEFGAVISYAHKRHYLEAFVWGCYSMATLALLLLALKSRA